MNWPRAEYRVTATVSPEAGQSRLLAAEGMDTAHARFLGCDVDGADIRYFDCAKTGQRALVLESKAGPVTLTYRYGAGPSSYPHAMFTPHDSVFNRRAQALTEEARAIAPNLELPQKARAIACSVAEKFHYGHPEQRFNDGYDHVPALCGLTEGSCVDINTYFLASLRAAGIEAGYATGYFFPAEKRDRTFEMHCWVVTRYGDLIEEWDIAHHLKMGTSDIRPAFNPKPGFRSALAHSMGLDFPELGLSDLKLISQPVWLIGESWEPAELDIRLHHPALNAVAAP
ncbi:MAG: transglutaminase-like domain-containing protein [Pseudomonadota bacterium]